MVNEEEEWDDWDKWKVAIGAIIGSAIGSRDIGIIFGSLAGAFLGYLLR
jgi:tetrahydromethanopterin S-methyltransferase subunit G